MNNSHFDFFTHLFDEHPLRNDVQARISKSNFNLPSFKTAPYLLVQPKEAA